MRAAAVVVVAVASAGVAAGLDALNTTYDFGALRHYLDTIAPFYGNFTMTVGDATGKLFEHSTGEMTPDVVLPLASGSKWPAVTALVGCFAANGVDLDDPLNKYLDWWSTTDNSSAVTIRHVLSMTTGMISDPPSGNETNVTDDYYAISTHASRSWELCSEIAKGNVSTCARAMYDAVVPIAPITPPGSKFMYSSFGFQWAAAVAEVVEGAATGDILTKYVLDPAGMSPTCSWSNQDLNPLLGGGLECSARKLDRFVHGMLVDKIVDAQTRQEMETVQLTDPSMYGSASLFWGAYCLGNWLECLNNFRVHRPMPTQCFRADRHGHPGCGGYWNYVFRKRGYYFNFLPSYNCTADNNYCDSPMGDANCPALYGWAQTVRTASALYLDDIFGVGF